MTTSTVPPEATQRFSLMDTLLCILAGSAMTMVSLSFLVWLRA